MILKNKCIALNIANEVTANQCANIVLAAGASPVMSKSIKDIKDLIKISKSLTINIGTVNKKQTRLIFKAIKFANKNHVPFILDPVGSGASAFRTRLSRKIAQKNPVIIRGNASEIMSLVNDVASHGVDSSIQDIVTDNFKKIAVHFKTTVFVTGKKDLIINNELLKENIGGNLAMTLTTGIGCMLSSLVGALITEMKPFEAALLASKIMKKMGEKLYTKDMVSYSQMYNFVKNYE